MYFEGWFYFSRSAEVLKTIPILPPRMYIQLLEHMIKRLFFAICANKALYLIQYFHCILIRVSFTLEVTENQSNA